MIKGIVFDADGTLLEVENPYLAIARGLRCEDQVISWVRDYLANKLDYLSLVRLESELFRSAYKDIYGDYPKTGDLERFFYPPATRDGAKDLFVSLKNLGVNTYVLSTGFYYLVKDLYQLDIVRGNIHSNRLLYDTEGEFMGIKASIVGDKIDGYTNILREAGLKDEETAYVGDNAFDLALMNHILSKNGWVFLFKQAEKDFKITELPSSPHLISIENLDDIITNLPAEDSEDLN